MLLSKEGSEGISTRAAQLTLTREASTHVGLGNQLVQHITAPFHVLSLERKSLAANLDPSFPLLDNLLFFLENDSAWPLFDILLVPLSRNLSIARLLYISLLALSIFISAPPFRIPSVLSEKEELPSCLRRGEDAASKERPHGKIEDDFARGWVHLALVMLEAEAQEGGFRGWLVGLGELWRSQGGEDASVVVADFVRRSSLFTLELWQLPLSQSGIFEHLPIML